MCLAAISDVYRGCVWQVVYSTDCSFTVLSLTQNYTRFFLKLVRRHLYKPMSKACTHVYTAVGGAARPPGRWQGSVGSRSTSSGPNLSAQTPSCLRHLSDLPKAVRPPTWNWPLVRPQGRFMTLGLFTSVGHWARFAALAGSVAAVAVASWAYTTATEGKKRRRYQRALEDVAKMK